MVSFPPPAFPDCTIKETGQQKLCKAMRTTSAFTARSLLQSLFDAFRANELNQVVKVRNNNDSHVTLQRFPDGVGIRFETDATAHLVQISLIWPGQTALGSGVGRQPIFQESNG
eukprot:1080134-Rhodomonas_salina.1